MEIFKNQERLHEQTKKWKITIIKQFFTYIHYHYLHLQKYYPLEPEKPNLEDKVLRSI